jgi:tRNA 2-thiouridine synthesizing protein A
MRVFEYDLVGLMCPIPVIRVNKKLNEMDSGDVIVAAVTDPIARYDFPDYCRSTGHQFMGMKKDGDQFFFSIKRK